MFLSRKKKKPSNPFSSTHKMRIKRGKKRYYPKSSLRRRMKRNLKRWGNSKKTIRKSTRAGWP